MAEALVPEEKVWMIKASRDLETARRTATGKPHEKTFSDSQTLR